MSVRHFARMAACVAALALLAGCAPKSYSVRHPAPSEHLVFGTAAPATTLALVDARPGAGRAFSSGVLPAALTVDGAPLDAAGYLAKNLQAELVARGLPTQVELGGNALPTLELTAFRMQNHRVNGFSPFVTLTFLGGDLVTPTGKQRLGVFVKRGKVPSGASMRS